MKILTVDNKLNTRDKLHKILSTLGNCASVNTISEMVDAYKSSWLKCQPYDLICINIKMHSISNKQVLNDIREIEREMDVHESLGVKVIIAADFDDHNMTLDSDSNNVYLYKPFNNQEALKETCMLGLL